MRSFQIAIAVTMLAALAGCASFGGNIKGDFICRAPDGTCSPTSNIDDQAVARIGGEEQAASVPAAATAMPGPAGNTLKVVMPARYDRFGRWRDEAVVYVDKEPPAAASAHPVPSAGPRSPSIRLTLAELAAGAPEVGEIAPALPVPSRASTTPADPVARIKADVEARLQAAPRYVSVPVVQGQPLPQVQTSGTSVARPPPASDTTVSPDGKIISSPTFPASESGGE